MRFFSMLWSFDFRVLFYQTEKQLATLLSNHNHRNGEFLRRGEYPAGKNPPLSVNVLMFDD